MFFKDMHLESRTLNDIAIEYSMPWLKTVILLKNRQTILNDYLPIS